MNNNELEKISSRGGYISEHQLSMYFIFTFAITWGIAATVLIFMPWLVQIWGPLSLDNPYYFTLWMIAVYGPPISAFSIIFISYGKKGLKIYLKRLLNWRFGVIGVVLLISIPIIGTCANFIYIAMGGQPKELSEPWYILLLLSVFMLIYDPGPMEELGWRGFALPKLQQKYSALWSSIILGFIWAVWHIPAFYIAALPQSSFSLPLFIISTIALAIIMTVAYNKSEGSIPLAFLLHWLINLNGMYFNVEDITFFLVETILYICLAVLLIIIFSPKNLGKSRYTTPLPEI